MPERGTSSPMRSIASLNNWRSSPFAIACAFAPINFTPCRASAPLRFSSIAALSAVCPPMRGQNRVRFFAFHDRLDHFRRDRLDIGAIGELRIGHDRGRVRVHQHDLVAFFAQRLAGLHAGIIKFAALPDDDWTGADEENFLELVIPRHLRQRGR